MQYSPKLKKAMEQIKEILKENDIAAFVVLHTPGHSEYLNHTDTSYSCAKLSEEGFRFRLKESEVGKEKAKEIAEGTYNMLTHFADVIAAHTMAYMKGQEFIQKKWGGEGSGGEHTSHSQQNS